MKINELINNLSNNLKKFREDKGLTQDDLAELTGISRSLISQYEICAKNPPVDKLLLLANALNLTFDQLLGFKPVKLQNPDISFSTLKKARTIDRLPTRSKNQVYKLVEDLAKKIKD